MRRLYGAVVCGVLCFSPLFAQVSLRGGVLDIDGRPLEGVLVEATAIPPGYEMGRLRLAVAPLEPVVTSRSGADGWYAFDLPGIGVFKVTVRSASHLPMELMPLAVAGDITLPPVVLGPGRELPLALETAGGEPLPRTAAIVHSSSRTGRSGWRQAFRFAFTDATGDAQLVRGPDEQVTLSVFPPGGSEQVRHGFEGGALRLEPDASVETCRHRLRVVGGADERAQDGVLVRSGELAWPMGVTDGDGRFDLVAPCGRQRVLLMTRDGRQRWHALAATSGASTVTLSAPAVLRGKVTDSKDRPLASALVWTGADPGSFVLTDDEGRFRLTAPTDDRFWIQAEAPGYSPNRRWVRRAGPGPVLRLARAGGLRGQVVGSDSKPLAGVELAAFPSGGRRGRPFFRLDPADARSTSDADGLFRLPGLRTGAYALRAHRTGYVAQVLELAVSESSESGATVRFELTPARPVVGRVTDAHGVALADVTVRLAPAGLDAKAPWTGISGRESQTRSSGPDGRFRFDRQPARRFELTAEKAGYAPAAMQSLDALSGQGPIDVGRVVLAPAAALTGRVVDIREEPVPEAEVYVFDPEVDLEYVEARMAPDQQPDALADDAGRFTLDGLVAGSRMGIRVAAPGFVPRNVAGVEVDGRELEVVLEAAMTLTGQVVDTAGEGVAGARLTVAWPNYLPDFGKRFRLVDKAVQTTRTDPEGRFEVTGEAGSAEIEVEAEGFLAPEPLQVEMAPDRSDPVRIVLERGSVLEGAVATADGTPLPSVRLAIGSAHGVSDEEGRYHLTGVADGPGEARAFHPDYDILVEQVDVEPGVNTLDWVFPNGSRVSGSVVDEHDQALPGVLVRLDRVPEEPSQEYRVLTDPEGGFLLPRVADGRYHLMVSGRGYAPVRRSTPLEVRGRALDALEVVLAKGTRLEGRIEGLEPWQWSAVKVEARGVDHVAEGRVGYDGRYEVVDLGPGRWRLRASLDAGRRTARGLVAIEPGQAVVEQDLEFGDGFALSGTALYEGQPVEGALISLRGLRSPVDRSVKTSFEGAFEFRDLPPGSYRLGLTHTAHALVYNRRLDLAEDQDLTIELEPSSVEGHVLDAAGGRPVARALVNLVPTGQGKQVGGAYGTGTDEDGFFALPRVPPGSYQLEVNRDGYAVHHEALEVAAGVQLGALEVLMERTEGLRLVVLTDLGRVPSHVEVRAMDDSGRMAVTLNRPVDHRGEVHLADLPAGTWRLLVRAPDTAVGEVRTQVPAETASVVLREGRPLVVQVPELFTSELIAELTLARADGTLLTSFEPGEPVRDRWLVVAGIATLKGIPAGVWTSHGVVSRRANLAGRGDDRRRGGSTSRATVGAAKAGALAQPGPAAVASGLFEDDTQYEVRLYGEGYSCSSPGAPSRPPDLAEVERSRLTLVRPMPTR